MFKPNKLFRADSYKYSHYLQYPEGMTDSQFYLEPRYSKVYDKVMSVLLQYEIKRYLLDPITMAEVENAAPRLKAHFFGADFCPISAFKNIVKKYDGFYPVEIRAVPEGSVVPLGNVLMKVVPTDPEYFWLPGWLETSLHRAFWYPATVATNDFREGVDIMTALLQSCDNPEAEFLFRNHDFGGRGVSSGESAMIGGGAHLSIFAGSDTLEAVDMMDQIYGGLEISGHSIAATEHSTTTAWGPQGEKAMWSNMIDKFAKYGIFAAVADSYDFDNAISNIWGKELRDKLLASGATVVMRPDSGDAKRNILYALEHNAANFGWEVNSKGYVVLNKAVRIIQGDGINPESLSELLRAILDAGYSAENVAFGEGGGKLQKLDRDTYGWAYKESLVEIAQERIPVCKMTPGKKSKSGDLDLIKRDGSYMTIDRLVDNGTEPSELELRYRDGKLYHDYTLPELREKTFKAVMEEAKARL